MSLPYFNFYTSDFIAGTSHFDHTEKGVFVHLLCLCWESPNGSIPHDQEWIFRRLRPNGQNEIVAIRNILREKFKINRGRYYNKRLLEERKKSKRKYDNKCNANRKRSKINSAKSKEATVVNSLNDNTISSRVRNKLELQSKPYEDKSSSLGEDDDAFDRFWLVYPGTQGQNKAMAYKAWCELTYIEKGNAIDSIMEYNRHLKTNEPKAQPWFPNTYLRDKIFETFLTSKKPMHVVKKGTYAWTAWRDYKVNKGSTYFPDTMTVPSALPPEPKLGN